MQRNRESLTGLRILIAEDEALVAMLIEEMLEELRCEIVGPVSTVEAAVAAIQNHRLDGALLDMNLHGKIVAPAAEALLDRGVPFLLVTGYGNRDSDAPALKQAPRLKKPFSLPDLADAMTEALVRPSGER